MGRAWNTYNVGLGALQLCRFLTSIQLCVSGCVFVSYMSCKHTVSKLHHTVRFVPTSYSSRHTESFKERYAIQQQDLLESMNKSYKKSVRSARVHTPSPILRAGQKT